MLVLKMLLFIVSVVIAFWTVVLFVSAHTSKELGGARRRLRHRR